MWKMRNKLIIINKKYTKIICCVIFLNMSFAAFGMRIPAIPASKVLVLAKEAVQITITLAMTEILKFKALFVQKIDLAEIKTVGQPLPQRPLNLVEPLDIFKGHGLQEQVLKEVFAQVKSQAESKQTNQNRNVTYFKNLTQRQNEKTLDVGIVSSPKDTDSAVAKTGYQAHEVSIVLAQPQQAQFDVLQGNQKGMVICNGSEAYTLAGTTAGAREKSFPQLSIDLPVDKQKVDFARVKHFNDLSQRSETGSLTVTMHTGMTKDPHLAQSLRLLARNQQHTQKAIIFGGLISKHSNEFLKLLQKNDALYKPMFDQKITELERIKKRLEFGIVSFELPSFFNEYARCAQHQGLNELFEGKGNLYILDDAQDHKAEAQFVYYKYEVSQLMQAIQDAKAGKKDIQAAPILLAKSEDNLKVFKRGFLEPFCHQETLEELKDKIRNNKGNQYLYDAICTAQEGNLQEASSLLSMAEDAYRANGAKNLNACVVVADFIRKEQIRLHDLYIDKHELPRAYANDPLYAEYHAILDTYGPDHAKIRSNAMLHLTLRQMAVQGLYEKLDITERTALLDKLFYGICELQYHPVQTLEYLASQDICKNSTVEEHRTACSILFTDSGIPKFYAIRSEYTPDCSISDAINNSESLAARILQTQFYMQDAKNPQEIAIIKTGLSCLHKSVASEGIVKKTYTELAQNLFDALVAQDKSEKLKQQIDLATQWLSVDGKHLNHTIAGIINQQFNLLKIFKDKPQEVQRIYSLSDAIGVIVADIQKKSLSAAEFQLKELAALLFSDVAFSPHISKDLIALCGLQDTQKENEEQGQVPPCIAVPKEGELRPACNLPEMDNSKGMQGRLPGLEKELEKSQKDLEALDSKEAQETVLPECGRSQSRNLPSFGQDGVAHKEKVDETEEASSELKKAQEEAAGASDQKELISEEQLQNDIKKILDDTNSYTQEEQIVLDKFVKTLAMLIKNYGYDEVINATKLFKVTKARIANDKFILDNIEAVAKILNQKIDHQNMEVKEVIQLIEAFNNGAQYHVDIDREKLKLAIELFKDTPGAIIDNGPLKKVLKFGITDSAEGKLAVARGAMYELEIALRLLQENKKIVAFGIKLRGSNSRNEFDILASDILVECKDVDWKDFNSEIAVRRRNVILQQKKVSNELGLGLRVYSKKEISAEKVEWFDKFNIEYFEDKG